MSVLFTNVRVFERRRLTQQSLEMAGTPCIGAATAKPRLHVVTRNAIDSGQNPSPRYRAASQEITVPRGLGDETLPTGPKAGSAPTRCDLELVTAAKQQSAGCAGIAGSDVPSRRRDNQQPVRGGRK